MDGLMGFLRQHIVTIGVTAGAVVAGIMLMRQTSSRLKTADKNTASVSDLPVIDLKYYLNRDKYPEEAKREIAKVAEALHKFGCFVAKDPRVEEKHNSQFLDMLERYFSSSDGKTDARPELSFQVGVTPEMTEQPRNHCSRAKSFDKENKPVTICPPGADPKWRFFWRIGPQPKSTKYPGLNADPVIPDEFPEWHGVMNMWGNKMLAALDTLAGMAAEGLDLPPTTFQDMMSFGPHLLAPTGSDFSKYNQVDTALAGFHYDLNFLTIHGKSRFPGLYVWLRDGRRVPVKVPEGHLIVQAGKQIEYLTGGHVLAGFHEVVVSEATVKTIEKRRAEGKALWRVSSTLFGHIASDHSLRPLGRFDTPEARAQFPAIDAGQQVQKELEAIALDQGYGGATRPE
uniref:Isopenicillin N synthase-like Fe(2+) 2OG dioxygenase domain-containing protein n=1 Tax=Rhizochromulina marina TaxID=1034831 RepID=A0A7S2S0B3_9STRA